MKPVSSLVAAAALALATPAFAHDYQAGDIAIIHPWIVEPPPGAQAAAGYGVIANDGEHDDRLLAIRTEAARMAEIHEMTVDDAGVMQMREIPGGLPVAAGDAVVLEPGGYHLMLMHLSAPLAIDDMVPVTLVFEHAGEVEVEFIVQARGAATDHHGDHTQTEDGQ